MISGKPVRSSIARTAMPASASVAAVPPVETISIPSSASPRANSTIPVLSETDSRARAICGPPGGTPAPSVPADVAVSASPLTVSVGSLLASIPAATLPADPHAPRVGGVELDRPLRNLHHRLDEQLVLDRVQALEHLLGALCVGQLDRPLEDDRAGVHTRIDGVNGDAEHLHAVVERRLDDM